MDLEELLRRVEELPLGESEEDRFMKVLLGELSRVFDEHPRESSAIADGLVVRCEDPGLFLAELFLRFHNAGWISDDSIIGFGACKEWSGDGFV